MKRLIALGLTGVLAISLTACSRGENFVKDDTEQQYLGEELEDKAIYPISVEGYVGDTMPFYDDGEYYIFYLADQRKGTQGYHPWGMMSTKDFGLYEDFGEVIPYGATGDDQDIALGTGSVVKDKDGLYHAFYTGHNDMRAPKEAVMHATSKDMKTWDKIPEDTFTGKGVYSEDDFRDPYVFYVEEENQYWMLVATRYHNEGVIAKYTSEDLSSWKDAGVFFIDDMGAGTNLECPMVIQYGDYWYLSFSDQWPNRQVHYRVSNSIDGEYVKPEKDVFDGNGFYAGRLVSDGTDLFVVGWNATKRDHTDSKEYDWGGNLITHKLKADKDGNLVPVVNEEVKALFDTELELLPKQMTESIVVENNAYTMNGDQYEYVGFKPILGSYMLEADVTDLADATEFGLCFNTDVDGVGKLNIMLDKENNRIAFYNTSSLIEEDPQSEVDYDFSNKDKLHLTAFISDGIVCLYVNDEIAMTTRMYLSQGMKWGLCGINSSVKWENVRIYK